MSGGRFFSDAERSAIFAAANGRCEYCGAELDPGWHADHIEAASLGGPTDVVNGRASCSTCNLRKGAGAGSRGWQIEATKEYAAANASDFTLAATPGAGKTRWACEIASGLKRSGTIDRIVVVVPSTALKLQWADAADRFGIDLRPMENSDGREARDADGCTVTYAQVAAASYLHRQSTGRARTLVIFDEIHHAGEVASWGAALREAFDPAVRRIALTGTPWRRDGAPIPFVSYSDDGQVEIDYSYDYGRAVRDDVCRRIAFHAYDGSARWQNCGTILESTVAEARDEDMAAVLDAMLDPAKEWIPAILQTAVYALDDLRREVPDAAGLVIADSQYQAHQYARIIGQLARTAPVVVVSDDPDAKTKIDQFRNSTNEWIVAVRMVSEGVDIPRLALGVYATRTKTPLFFQQVVGRFVRTRPDEEVNASLFMPAVPALMEHAKRIEEQLTYVRNLEIDEIDQEYADREKSQQTLNLNTILAAGDAALHSTIQSGEELTPSQIAAGEEHCKTFGIPTIWAAAVARMLLAATPPIGEIVITHTPPPAPQHRHAKQLRGDLQTLVNKLGMALGGPEQIKSVNGELLGRFGPRGQMPVSDLEQAIDWVLARLGDV